MANPSLPIKPTEPPEVAPTSADDNFGLKSLFQPPVEFIHQSRDVVLHVVDDKNLESRFQVSTHILAQACPFLDRLLNGNFVEGRKNEANATGTRQVTVKENRTAIQILCYVIHHKPLGDIVEKLSPDSILDYAVLVDKYQCVNELRLPNESLLLQTQVKAQSTSRSLQRAELCDLIAAAQILDMPCIYRELTRQLVSVGDSNIQLGYFDNKNHPHIPRHFFTSINAQVSAVQKALIHHVGVLISEFSKAARILDKDPLVVKFQRRLTDAGLLPVELDSPELSIKILTQRLEEIEVPALLSDTGSCHCANYIGTMASGRYGGTKHISSCDLAMFEERTAVPVTQRHARYAARNVREACVGLCLDCVKRPGSQSRSTCRVTHPRPWVEHARDSHDHDIDLDLDIFRTRKQRRPTQERDDTLDQARFYVRLLAEYPTPRFWRDAW